MLFIKVYIECNTVWESTRSIFVCSNSQLFQHKFLLHLLDPHMVGITSKWNSSTSKRIEGATTSNFNNQITYFESLNLSEYSIHQLLMTLNGTLSVSPPTTPLESQIEDKKSSFHKNTTLLSIYRFFPSRNRSLIPLRKMINLRNLSSIIYRPEIYSGTKRPRGFIFSVSIGPSVDPYGQPQDGQCLWVG